MEFTRQLERILLVYTKYACQAVDEGRDIEQRTTIYDILIAFRRFITISIVKEGLYLLSLEARGVAEEISYPLYREMSSD